MGHIYKGATFVIIKDFLVLQGIITADMLFNLPINYGIHDKEF